MFFEKNTQSSEKNNDKTQIPKQPESKINADKSDNLKTNNCNCCNCDNQENNQEKELKQSEQKETSNSQTQANSCNCCDCDNQENNKEKENKNLKQKETSNSQTQANNCNCCNCDNQENNQEKELEKEINKLKLQLEQQKKEFDEQILKNQAELINFKKRSKQQNIQDVKYASMNFIGDLLMPLEQLEKVLEYSTDNELLKKYLSGFRMIQQQIQNVLQTEGVEEIKALDKIFDPALHHAIETISDRKKPNKTNLKVLQKGYLYKEKILRPAMVQVNEWSDENGKN
ncbi:nucleotide exchange factor GrpE [Candidatus Phytoplasma solani]|uniref:nucleotide exchange factor GrpE n=1 Tax=Candidatus Phytoplasma solani TaxID=69896 RepID=UPI00358DF7B4